LGMVWFYNNNFFFWQVFQVLFFFVVVFVNLLRACTLTFVVMDNYLCLCLINLPHSQPVQQ